MLYSENVSQTAIKSRYLELLPQNIVWIPQTWNILLKTKQTQELYFEKIKTIAKPKA